MQTSCCIQPQCKSAGQLIGVKIGEVLCGGYDDYLLVRWL